MRREPIGRLKGLAAFLVRKRSDLASGGEGRCFDTISTIPTLSSLCLTFYELKNRYKRESTTYHLEQDSLIERERSVNIGLLSRSVDRLMVYPG